MFSLHHLLAIFYIDRLVLLFMLITEVYQHILQLVAENHKVFQLFVQSCHCKLQHAALMQSDAPTSHSVLKSARLQL